jgi:hypothetical protein
MMSVAYVEPCCSSTVVEPLKKNIYIYACSQCPLSTVREDALWPGHR